MALGPGILARFRLSAVIPALLDALAHPFVHLPLDPAHGARSQRDRAGEAPLVQPHIDRAPRQTRAGLHLRQPQEPVGGFVLCSIGCSLIALILLVLFVRDVGVGADGDGAGARGPPEPPS